MYKLDNLLYIEAYLWTGIEQERKKDGKKRLIKTKISNVSYRIRLFNV